MRTFVTVHDADLIADCDRRFAGLHPTYLFVGPRRPPARPDVIHCAAHTPNLEHLPQFYDFTGWYVLADLIHRGEIDDPHLLLVQYDMWLKKTAHRIGLMVPAMLKRTPGPLSFEIGRPVDWRPKGHPEFADVFRVGLATLGVDADALSSAVWPTTQGTAWRTAEFVEFMLWFTPLFDVFADHVLAGHLAERSIHAWCQSTGRPARIVENTIRHESRDCHGTTALFYGDTEGWEARSATFGR